MKLLGWFAIGAWMGLSVMIMNWPLAIAGIAFAILYAHVLREV